MLKQRLACLGSFLVAVVGALVPAQSSAPTGLLPPTAPQNSGQYQPPGSPFLPVEVWPRVADLNNPVPPTTGCPIARFSGIMGFQDPITERDWGVAGRSDGLLLLDCTVAPPTGTQSFSVATIAASNTVDWLTEPGPHAVHYAEPALNGLDTDHSSPTFGQRLQRLAYCAGPGGQWPFPYTSLHTTNREVVAWYDASVDRFWVFSVNTARAGIWAVPLVRTGSVLTFDAGNSTWLMPTGLGRCHTIYLDAGKKRLFLTDDTSQAWAVAALQIQPGATNAAGILAMSPVWTYAPSAGWRNPDTGQYHAAGGPYWPPTPRVALKAHDAMPSGDYLYVTYGGLWEPDPNIGNDAGWGIIDILSLADGTLLRRVKCGPSGAPLAGWGIGQLPVFPRYPTLAGAHTVYLEGSSTPEASLWVVQEDATPVTYSNGVYTSNRVAAVRLGYSSPLEEEKFREAVKLVLPFGQQPGHLPSRIHYLRGIGRIGILTHYTDGLSLLDLSEVFDQSSSGWFSSNLAVLGSYDTSHQTEPLSYQYQDPSGNWGPPNNIQGVIDGFLGCWDAYPHLDSGLLLATCGESGVAVFQLQEGFLNRFGSATKFDSQASSSGWWPRIELMSGPPRQDRQMVVRDGSRGSYAAVSPAPNSVPVKYMYKMRYTSVDQFTVSPYSPFANSIPASGSIYVNGTPQTMVETPWSDSDILITPPLPAQSTRFFAQMLVHEYRFVSGQWQAQPYWAASRGTWFGVAKQ